MKRNKGPRDEPCGTPMTRVAANLAANLTTDDVKCTFLILQTRGEGNDNELLNI